MGKIAFWLVVVFGVLLALRLLNVAKDRSRPKPESEDRLRRRRGATMVRCVNCGVFLPRAEATESPRGPTCGEGRCARSAGQHAA